MLQVRGEDVARHLGVIHTANGAGRAEPVGLTDMLGIIGIEGILGRIVSSCLISERGTRKMQEAERIERAGLRL